MKANTAGNLIIPVLAIAYAVYMVWEQLAGSYRASTVNYALLTGGAVVLLSAAVIIRSLMAARAEPDAASKKTPADAGQTKRYVRGVAVFVLAALLVYSFEWIGYAIGFFAFSLATLQLLDVRSIALNVFIPLGIALVVHFVFVNWLGLPLPAGLLRGVL